MTFRSYVQLTPSGGSRARRRISVAVLGSTLAVLIAAGAALGAQGDLAYSRLSGLVGGDLWSGVAAYASSVYVGGGREHAAILRRYSRSGAVIWTRTIHGPGSTSASISAVAADASGVYAAGAYFVAGVRRAFVARYRPNATQEWVEPLDLGDESFATAIDTFGSSIYVAGSVVLDQLTGATSGFVRKVTRDAVEVWTRHLDPDFEADLQMVEPTGVAAAADAVYLVGRGFRDGGSDKVVFMRKYDGDGDFPQTDARPLADAASAFAVAADQTGAYVVAQAEALDPANGGSFSPYGSFLLKYDDTASLVWQRRITARSSTLANAVAIASSGIWITGTASDRLTNRPGTSADLHGDAFAVRYSRSGTQLLTYQYSAPGRQFGLGIFADGVGAYLVGLATRFGSRSATGEIDGLLLSVEVP